MGPCSVRAIWFCAADDIRSYMESGPKAGWFQLPTTVICKDAECYRWFLGHEIDLVEVAADLDIRAGFDPAERMTQMLAAIAGRNVDFVQLRFAPFEIDPLSSDHVLEMLLRKYDCVSFEIAIEAGTGIHYPAAMLARRYSAVARDDVVVAEPESFFFSASLLDAFRPALACADWNAADVRLVANRVAAAAQERLHVPLLLGLAHCLPRAKAPAPFVNPLVFELFGAHADAGGGPKYGLSAPAKSIGAILLAIHAARGLQRELGDFVRFELFLAFIDLWREAKDRVQDDLRAELRAFAEAVDATAMRVVDHLDIPVEDAVQLLRGRIVEEAALSDDEMLRRILWALAHPAAPLPEADAELAPFATLGQQLAAASEARRLRDQVDHWRAECARFAMQMAEERARNRRLRQANEQLRRQVASRS